MRLKLQEQLPLVFREVDHRRAQELRRIDDLLNALGTEVLDHVHSDLVRGLDRPDVGRTGLSADVALRCVLVKQLFCVSYESLEFMLRDSESVRQFCRVRAGGPSRSAIHRAIKRLTPQTFETINRTLMRYAQDIGVESADTVGVDATVTSANIRDPTDSGLLVDVIRVGTRLLLSARRQEVHVPFVDHRRLAKRKHLKIHHARRKIQRVKPYRRLLWAARRVIRWCHTALERLGGTKLGDELAQLIDTGTQVINQARRRVIKGESVPASKKVVFGTKRRLL